MDNVTHTLVGALLGEAAARAVPGTGGDVAAGRRAMFLSVMIVGSNLPDSDLVYSLISDNKLDYLLEHRGHTHTVIGALAASAVLLGGCWLWLRARRLVVSGRDRACLVGLALAAPLLHVAMDYANSYGVHPWWPFDNHWLYGDSVFIVEPLFWASAAPLAFLWRTALARGIVVLALGAGLYLALRTGLVAGPFIAFYGALALAMLAAGRFARPGAALGIGIGTWIATTLVFTLASREAAMRVDSYAASQFPRATLLDRVLTPTPMNPFCWDVILIQSEDDRYALRRATLSLAPSIMPRCRALGDAVRTTAPLQSVRGSDSPALRWRGEIVMDSRELRRRAATNCEVAAFLRFSRAPWFSPHSDAVIGDLRFDREPELGFAELDLAGPPQCPGYVPPWTPPRNDLLRWKDP